MYWPDIGTTVRHRVRAHLRRSTPRTAARSRRSARSPATRRRAQIERFRQLARVYGAPASAGGTGRTHELAGLARHRPAGRQSDRLQPEAAAADALHVAARDARKGDLVVWAQEHLLSAGYARHDRRRVRRTDAVRGQSFQTRPWAARTGEVDPPTWTALLGIRPPTSPGPRGAPRRREPAAAAASCCATALRAPARRGLRDPAASRRGLAGERRSRRAIRSGLVGLELDRAPDDHRRRRT